MREAGRRRSEWWCGTWCSCLGEKEIDRHSCAECISFRRAVKVTVRTSREYATLFQSSCARFLDRWLLTMAAPVRPMPSELPVRLRAETDWAAFVDTYGRVILNWFRQSNLPADQVHSIVREILSAVHREFSAVASEPSLKFRSWLQYAANASWCLVLENLAQPEGEAQASAMAMLLLSLEAHDRFLK